MEEEKLIISNDVEGFTEEDYLYTPSYATVMEEYSDGMRAESILHNNTPILDQGSVGACSVFGITKSVNEGDWYDSKTQLDAMKIWDDAVKAGRIPNGGKQGWSMGGALNLMKELGHIQDWYFCKTPEDVRLALMKKHICYTGARLVDRRKTGQTNEIQINENADAGHLFALTGIDMNEYAHPNSWGEYWGDKGFFYTPFDKAKWLYSIVALIDKTNATPEVIEDTKDNEEIVKRGIRNGKLPDADLVKLHAVYMVMRAFFDQFDNDKAIAEALKKRIVRDVHGPLTRRWFLMMVFRAAYGDTTKEEMIPDVFEKMGIIKSKEWLDEPIKRYHAGLIIARTLRNLGKL